MADALDILVALQTSNAISTFDSMMRGFAGNSKLSQIGSALTGGLTVPIIAGLGAATKMSVDFNSAMQSSARTLDLTADETAKLSKEVLIMAPALGLMPTEFAKVAAEAGKLGVVKGEIADFGKVLATLSTISDVPIQDFTKKAGTIKTVFNQNTKEFELFGAAVNSLDDKIGGTTPNILEFTSRVGAVGKNMGLTAGEVAAFGAVFETVGISPERASTAFQNFAGQLFTIQSATPKAKAAFESMGYSADTFGKTMAANPKQALTDFLEKINGIQDPVKKSQLLVEIFGKSSSAEIASLATQAGKLGDAFKIAGDDTANLAKMTAEMGNKMKDPAMQAKVLQAQFAAIGIQIGSILVPVLTQVLALLTPLATSFSAFLTANPEWTKFFVVAATGLAIIGPLASAFATLIGIVTTVGGAIGTVSAIIASMGGVMATLSLIAGTVGTALAAFGAAVFSIPAAIAAAVAAIIALTFNIGGSRDAAIAFGAYLLDGLFTAIDTVTGAFNTFSQGLADGVSNAFNTALNVGQTAMQGLVSHAQSTVQSIIMGFQTLQGGITSAVQGAIQSSVSAIQGAANTFFSAGAGLMRAFADGVASSASAAYASVQSAVNNVRNLLPFSPAKEGPLADLHKSGAAFFKTFASGLNISELESKLKSGFGTALNSLGVTPGMTARSTVPNLNGLSAASAGAGNGSIIYNQNIDVNTTVDADDIIRALRNGQRDFLSFLESTEFMKKRRQT